MRFIGLGVVASLKLENQQEFVIGGYRPGSNGIDALLVGYNDDTGLRFAGKVRAGFVPHLRREVFKALKPHHVDECPFIDLPNSRSYRWGGGVTPDDMRETQWVKPELMAQIRVRGVDGRGSPEACRIPGAALGQERARGSATMAGMIRRMIPIRAALGNRYLTSGSASPGSASICCAASRTLSSASSSDRCNRNFAVSP